MANCYICGCKLSPDARRVRRTVKTGEWKRKSYTGNRTTAVQFHFGKRVLCRKCATLLDRRKEIGDIVWHLTPFLGLLALFVLTLFL